MDPLSKTHPKCGRCGSIDIFPNKASDSRCGFFCLPCGRSEAAMCPKCSLNAVMQKRGVWEQPTCTACGFTFDDWIHPIDAMVPPKLPLGRQRYIMTVMTSTGLSKGIEVCDITTLKDFKAAVGVAFELPSDRFELRYKGQELRDVPAYHALAWSIIHLNLIIPDS